MSQPLPPNSAKSEEIAQLAGVAVEQFQRDHRRAVRFEQDIDLQHSLATAIVELFPGMEITSLSGRLKIDNTTQPWAEIFTLVKAGDDTGWIGPARFYTLSEMQDVIFRQCLFEAGLEDEADASRQVASLDIDFKPLVWPPNAGRTSPKIVSALVSIMESHRQAQSLEDQTPHLASTEPSRRRM